MKFPRFWSFEVHVSFRILSCSCFISRYFSHYLSILQPTEQKFSANFPDFFSPERLLRYDQLNNASPCFLLLCLHQLFASLNFQFDSVYKILRIPKFTDFSQMTSQWKDILLGCWKLLFILHYHPIDIVVQTLCSLCFSSHFLIHTCCNQHIVTFRTL